MNIVVISGNLTKDTEYRSFDNGGISTSSIAVSRDYKSKDGEKETDFFIVKAFGKTAEIANNYGKKGEKAIVTGRLETRNYEDKTGVKRYITEIIAQSIEFIRKAENQSVKPTEQKPKGIARLDEIDDKDLPF